MSSRTLKVALACAVVVAAAGAPAAASVTFDPVTKSGFVGRAEVRDAFGWTDAALATRAPDLVFAQGFWTDDTYSASCGGATFAMVHQREYGSYGLVGTLAQRERGTSGPYHGKLIGFKLAGATSGISGTSVGPAVGQPCPQADPPGATIDAVDLVSSTTGWTLVVSYGVDSRELLKQETT